MSFCRRDFMHIFPLLLTQVHVHLVIELGADILLVNIDSIIRDESDKQCMNSTNADSLLLQVDLFRCKNTVK